jgi:regulator of sirC expression with transglutaminase-like and TPR domain
MSLAPEAIEAYERYLRVAPSAADAEAIRARVAHLRGS